MGSINGLAPEVDLSRKTTGSVAARFFLVGLFTIGVAVGVTVLLHTMWPPVRHEHITVPAAFYATTALLLATSIALIRAVEAVRRERQRRFFRSLLIALMTGTLFVGVQAYGLECLISGGQPGEAQTGSRPFIFVFAAMHGLHVTVALLFLVFVTVRARSGRYDHEYYWGPLITGWFWHALGIVWVVILAVIGISLW